MYENTNDVEILPYHGNGKSYPMPGSYTYQTGSEISFLAIPDHGWRFNEWQIDNNQSFSHESALELLINDHMTVQAIFVLDDTGVDSIIERSIEIYAYGNRIYVNTLIPNKELIIYDLLGKRVMNLNLENEGKFEFELDVPLGAYIVLIKGTNGEFSRKIIIRLDIQDKSTSKSMSSM